jgi:hypothetical protein
MKLLIMNFFSSVGCIPTGYELDDRVKNFLVSTSSSPALESTKPPIQWVPGAFSPAVKRPGSETDHSPPASADVKYMWIYISTPGARGSVVVKALCCKPEGRGFKSR